MIWVTILFVFSDLVISRRTGEVFVIIERKREGIGAMGVVDFDTSMSTLACAIFDLRGLGYEVKVIQGRITPVWVRVEDPSLAPELDDPKRLAVAEPEVAEGE
jgi:hypothetical protein